MGRHRAAPTQTRYPWRATVRTVFQAAVSLAAAAPFVYSAIAESEPDAAVGGAALALGVAGAVTRVMALPQVEDFLEKYLSWLAATPPPSSGDGVAGDQSV